ncbi:NfeD family protein [Pontibaca salina]|uniref:Nodulation protein NfeD n=1 Tax=Pontibaca salina TaxID=2795731 RepID=A0A934LZF1_9RHOB|nr:nodulation protein NfeD [Pontibaca salina]MBI6628930.1 nodulation protein NfeD [Pontibaca salina]
MIRITIFLLACLFAFGPASGSADVEREQAAMSGQGSGTVIVLDVIGPIGPATSEYLRQGFAAADDAEAIVVQIDTPGGLVQSMREIVLMFLASPVPVITYVAPGGARAASAGTYMVYGSHLAAMAPGTNIGAATPVRMGGAPQPLDEEEDADEEQPAPTDAMTAKSVNDAVAYIRALADLQGRNADWAEAAVRKAASLSANAALERDVIEIIAPDLDTLLTKADGRRVNLGGKQVTLRTAGLEVVKVPPDWRVKLIGILANPTFAYLLMLIGIYGVLFEVINPGALLPGVIGGISLILALFALNMLPINAAGAGLVLLGIVLMTAEAFAPSFGVLGIGGILAFGLGSVFMFEEVPGFHLSPGVIITATVASGVLLVVVLAAALRAHRRRVVSGDLAMIGTTGTVLSWSGQNGTVLVHGERWQARGTVPAAKGARVRVTARDGLTLRVEPAPSPTAKET